MKTQTAILREAAAELNTLRLLCDRYADKVERLTAALDQANDQLEAALRELREATRTMKAKRRECVYRTHAGDYSGFVEGNYCHFLPRFPTHSAAAAAAAAVPDVLIY